MKSAWGIEHGISKAFDPEAKRHARQKYYVGGLSGASAAAGVGSVVALKRKSTTHTETAFVPKHKVVYRHAPPGRIAGKFTRGKVTPVNQLAGGTRYLKQVTTKAPRNVKAAVGLAGVSAGAAGAAALIARHARKGGKTYTDQYER